MSEWIVDWLVFNSDTRSSMLPRGLLVQDTFDKSDTVEGG
jgi:hypothetical protein